MAVFKPVTIGWKGSNHTVPASDVIKLIAAIEEHISFPRLSACVARKDPPMAAIAGGFAAALEFVGVKVTQEEVYDSMFDADSQDNVATAINTLMVIMAPPGALARRLQALNGGKSQARGKRGQSGGNSTKASSARVRP